MSEFIAVDTNFILSVLIKRNNTETALKILSGAIDNYEKIFVPNHVIVETVYVLEGLHKYDNNVKKLEKTSIKNYIYSIINTPKIVLENKKIIEKALELYERESINFGDVLIAAIVLNKGIKKIISFDSHFLKIKELKVINSI